MRNGTKIGCFFARRIHSIKLLIYDIVSFRKKYVYKIGVLYGMLKKPYNTKTNTQGVNLIR